MKYAEALVAVFLPLLANGYQRSEDCNGKCSCIIGADEYSIQCPMEATDYDYTGPMVHLILKGQSVLTIQCTNVDDYNETLYPNVDFTNVTFVEMKFCPLPENSFHSLFEKLGLTNLKQLYFHHSYSKNVRLTKEHLKHLDNLEHLDLRANCELGFGCILFDDDFLEYVPNLVHLDLMGNNLSGIPSFQLPSKLKSLDLASNRIENFSKDFFSNTTDLKMLHLWNNNLKNITGDLFKDLPNLKSLELSSNLIDTIADDAFFILSELVNISLRSNRLRNFTRTMLRNNEKLENIRLSNNEHLYLEDFALSNKRYLKTVDLVYLKLKQVPVHLFQGSLNILEILLSNNEIETLPSEIFRDLSNVKKLDLSRNKITNLPDILFSPLKNLESLYLNDNDLTELNERIFLDLRKMKSINLKKNNISTIHINAFDQMREVRVIDLSRNRYTFDIEREPPFGRCEYLEELYLSHNELLTVLNSVIISKTHLKHLDLSYNRIDFVEVGSLLGVSTKLTINLSHNNISQVIFGAVTAAENENSGRSVTEVVIDDNPLMCDCKTLDLVRYARREKLYEIVSPHVEIKTENLRCTNLNNSKIEEVHPMKLVCPLSMFGSRAPRKCAADYRPYDTTVVINCAAMSFTKYPNITLPSNLRYNQTELHLEGNHLKVGPSRNLVGYNNITRLYLAHNMIHNISWIPPKLQVLTLDHNDLQSLNNGFLDKLGNISSLANVTLNNNPWICDCSTESFLHFIKRHYSKVNGHNIYCHGNNLTIMASEKGMCPSYITYYLTGGIILAAFLFSLSFTIACYYRYEIEVKAWMYAKNLCLWWVTEEELDKGKKYDVFISFSHKDEDFVSDNLLPVIDGPYSVCLHSRDFIPGEFIATQVVNSVEESRRTLVVLSNSFLGSVWGKLEFRTAHMQALKEGRARVILVILGDLDTEKLDKELQAYIRTNTYVKWGDPWFWNKLKYALPHSKRRFHNDQKHANIMMTIDDKFELVNSRPSSDAGTTPPVMSLDASILKNHPLNFTPPAEAPLIV